MILIGAGAFAVDALCYTHLGVKLAHLDVKAAPPFLTTVAGVVLVLCSLIALPSDRPPDTVATCVYRRTISARHGGRQHAGDGPSSGIRKHMIGPFTIYRPGPGYI